MDGAGFSHALIDHLTELNTARTTSGGYGRRGRRVEYSIGWPVDARTRAAIEALGDQDWSTALRADGGDETVPGAFRSPGVILGINHSRSSGAEP